MQQAIYSIARETQTDCLPPMDEKALIPCKYPYIGPRRQHQFRWMEQAQHADQHHT